MSWDAIGAIAELAGAIGVIASLIYLARQIRQSNATDKLTATLGLQASYNEVAKFFFEDEEYTSTGLNDLSKLDEGHRRKFAAKLYSIFSHIELVYFHHQKGMIDLHLVKRTYSLLYWYRDLNGVKQWWKGFGRDRFSSGFVAFVEGPEVKL